MSFSSQHPQFEKLMIMLMVLLHSLILKQPIPLLI